MTERYGPEDASIPSWEAPTGAPRRDGSGSSPGGGFSPPPPGAGPSIPASTPATGGVPTYRSWQPGFMPLRPLSLGDFLSLPMKAIGFNRQVLLGGPLLCVLVSMLAAAVATTLFLVEQQEYVRDFFFYFPNFPNRNLDPMGAETITAIVLASLFFIVTDAAARGFVVPGVSRAILGERITLGQAWETTRPRVLQILLLYFLVTLAALGAMLALGVLSVVAGPLYFLLILGVYVAAFYLVVVVGVAVSALVLERISAPEALSRAVSLMKGSSWRFIGNYFVISLVLNVIAQAIVMIPLIVVSMLSLASLNLAALFVIIAVVGLLAMIFLSMVQYSFLGTVFTLMYVDLRIRKEGFDVDLARAAEARAGR